MLSMTIKTNERLIATLTSRGTDSSPVVPTLTETRLPRNGEPFLFFRIMDIRPNLDIIPNVYCFSIPLAFSFQMIRQEYEY